ncbi:MAG: GGDEF domain-containing protein [Alphaproteobacteria bacterium]|nr:GGDEF domain-containing protein [Alphaproteobacteria bacterium]
MESLKNFFGVVFKGNSSENYPLLLTFAYIFALSLIALFTFVSHSITNYISDTQLERAEITYQLRSQSILVMEISRYASDYYNDSMRYDYIFMEQSIEKLESSYNQTIQYINTPARFDLGDAKETLGHYYFKIGFDIANKMSMYLKFSKEFANFSDTSSSQERQKVLSQLNSGQDRLLIELLNAAQADFQKETIDEIQSIMNIQLYMSGGIIFVILLEALFIFRPIIKKLDQYHVTIISQAMEDTLTGINNRRAFYKHSEAFFEKAATENKPFTVVLCDLDKFKSVNDTYGHEVGDEVLKHFAKTLTSALRPFDVVARLGGEEFALILGNTTPKAAAHILDRLLEIIRKNTCHYVLNDGTEGSLKYTTSVGYYVCHPQKILDVDTYLRYADLALYDAKEGGRDRHVRYLPQKSDDNDNSEEPAVAVVSEKADDEDRKYSSRATDHNVEQPA